MKKLILTLILALAIINVNAQTVIDSLWNVQKAMEKADDFDEKMYLNVVYQIMSICIDNGDINSAIRFLDDAKDVYVKKTNRANTSNYREMMTMLTILYYRAQNSLMADIYGRETEKKYEEAGDYNNRNYWDLLSIMSSICSYTCDTINALRYNQKAFDLYKKNLKKDIWNPKKIKSLWLQSLVQNFGINYWNLGDYQMAEKCFRVVLNSYEDDLSNSAYQTTCINLGELLSNQFRYEESNEILEKCIPDCQNQDCALKLYKTLTINYAQMQDTINASIMLGSYNNNVLSEIMYYYTNFSELARYDFWNATSAEAVSLNNWTVFKVSNPVIHRFAFTLNCFFRYLSLNYPILLDLYIKQSDNKEIISEYERFKNEKYNDYFVRDSIRTWSIASFIEEKMLNNIIGFDEFLISKHRMFEDIQNTLSDDELIIQFCDPPDNFDIPDNLPKNYYTAFIVSKKYICPLFYFLCRKDDFTNFISLNNEEEQLYYTDLYSKEKSNVLFLSIFGSIKRYLNNARTIYYSPSGILSNCNFDAFMDSTGTPLNEKYKMVRVSSIYDIPTIKSADITSSKSAAIFGNINFDSSFYESSRGYKFGQLKNAEKEIHTISDILKSHSITTALYEDKSATEQAFKNLSGHSPEILHIATHGFCFETDEKAADKPFAQNVNSYSQKESAMVLSGLALSGANNIWKGNFDLPNAEDGILTAYEISQLDLSNTRLAVLSACETARGRIFPVDGVFGLQRAFKQAGAGSILMSLWKVDDAATALFMEHFYKFLFETHDRHAALKKAQSEVKKQHPDPYYWAAWVMLD